MSPGLKAAVEHVLAARSRGGMQEKAGRLSRQYRAGGGSDGAIDLAAYLTVRLPATYAACARVLAEIAMLRPGFAPVSLIDAGAGPGTASWAAAALWPGLEHVTMVDRHAEFLSLAAAMARGSNHPALANVRQRRADMTEIGEGEAADLVMASYSLAEIAPQHLNRAAESLWRATRSLLVFVEPGTPAGFARLRGVRRHLVKQGAIPAAPCPHADQCPLEGEDWCHFSVRLARSRAHMHAKQARVPFEDERFSYLVLAREGGVTGGARVLAPPGESKAGMSFKLCTPDGLEIRDVARRDAATYKSHRKAAWGSLIGNMKEGKLMTRRQISSGSKFEAEIGYSRAIVDGDWMWVSGTTGFNYETMSISESAVEQADQTFKNIAAAMEKAGFALSDIVRCTYIFPDAKDFEPCWPVFRKYLGGVRPASTAMIAGLIDPRMKIEIEVTAKKSGK